MSTTFLGNTQRLELPIAFVFAFVVNLACICYRGVKGGVVVMRREV